MSDSSRWVAGLKETAVVSYEPTAVDLRKLGYRAEGTGCPGPKVCGRRPNWRIMVAASK